MGLIRKTVLLGAPTRLNSKKERTAKNTAKMAREAQRQTQMMEQQNHMLHQANRHQHPAPAPGPGPSIADELRKLGQLVHDGIIDRAEFDAAKARLLGPPQMPPAAGWWPDPTGRYDQRYFDGGRWTEHAAINAEQRQLSDPLPG